MSLTDTVTPTGPSAPEMDSGVGSEIVARINSIERAPEIEIEDGEAVHNTLPAMDLPGFGEKYEECGEETAIRFCESCGHTTAVGRTCYRSTCPRCASSWARRQATSVCSKLDAVRRYRSASTSDHQRFHHFVVSPPDGFGVEASDPYERVKTTVREIMDAFDSPGFWAYHPYRGPAGDDDRGKWKDRLNAEEWDDVEPELRRSGHFHVVAVSHEIPGQQVTAEIEARTGWVIHRITQENTNVSIGNDHDLARAVTYVLSHTGIYETGAGNYEAAYSYSGCQTDAGEEIVADDEERENEIDAIVRSVAPRTLGLPYNSLACVRPDAEERDDDHGAGPKPSPSVSLSEAAASRQRTASAGLDPTPSDAMDATDTTGVEEPDDAEPEKCEGRMLSIYSADSYLSDPEWCRRAPHSGELRVKYEEEVGPPPG